MANLYKYDGKIRTMTEDDLISAMTRAEVGARKGRVSYARDPIFREQIEEIKREWPDKYKNMIRTRVREACGGEPVTGRAVCSAIMSCLWEQVAPARAAIRNSEYFLGEYKGLTADFCLSTIFRRAPDPAARYKPRQYMSDGPVVAFHANSKPGKLVCSSNEMENAELFVLALYVGDLRRSWLMGWASKEKMLAAPMGNCMSDPDNCEWASMAHYMEWSALSPMSSFLDENGISSIPEGILFESVPNPNDLPLRSALTLEDGVLTEADEASVRKDFYNAIGISPPDTQVIDETRDGE